jgi:hypothetical protein
MAWTFTMVCVAWVFFRAESVGEATQYLIHALDPSEILNRPEELSVTAFAFVAALLIGDWSSRNNGMPKTWFKPVFLPIRWGIASVGIWFILKNFASQADFIYFQF